MLSEEVIEYCNSQPKDKKGLNDCRQCIIRAACHAGSAGTSGSITEWHNKVNNAYEAAK